MIPEASIAPATDVPPLASLPDEVDSALLSETVVLKLNGGLGTGMGLDFAKSLLVVKGQDTFLDLTAKQVLSMRKKLGVNVRFMLMNSFSTSKDTMDFLKKCESTAARLVVARARRSPRARRLAPRFSHAPRADIAQVPRALGGPEPRVRAEQGT